MLNNVNGFNYLRNVSMFPKEKLPKYPISGFNGTEIICNEKSSVDKEIEEFKKTIAQSNGKKVEVTNIATGYTKDILPKEKINLPFASFWGIEN